MGAAVIGKLRAALEAALHPSELEIIDDSERHAGHPGAQAGGHYQVRLTAAAFRGVSARERHRLVYAAVAPLLAGEVHALNIRARAPGEAP